MKFDIFVVIVAALAIVIVVGVDVVAFVTFGASVVVDVLK